MFLSIQTTFTPLKTIRIFIILTKTNLKSLKILISNKHFEFLSKLKNISVQFATHVSILNLCYDLFLGDTFNSKVTTEFVYLFPSISTLCFESDSWQNICIGFFIFDI